MKISEQMNKVEQNHLGHFLYLPKILGFDVHEINNIEVINCALKTSMFNIVYGEPKNIMDDINQIKRLFKAEPFAWWIPKNNSKSDVKSIMIQTGFIIENTEHAMICELNNYKNFERQTDLLVMQVTNKKTLSDFISILEIYDGFAADFYNCLSEELFDTREKLFVGYIFGKPVNIGILYFSGDSAGIFSLITDKNFQGKGYGTDMMIFMMEAAKQSGCNFITLSASSDSGYRIYERLGFFRVGEFECFEYKDQNKSL